MDEVARSAEIRYIIKSPWGRCRRRGRKVAYSYSVRTCQGLKGVTRALGVTTILASPCRTPLCGVDDVSGCTFQAVFTDKIQRRGLQFWAIFPTIAYQCVEKDKLNLWDTCADFHVCACQPGGALREDGLRHLQDAPCVPSAPPPQFTCSPNSLGYRCRISRISGNPRLFLVKKKHPAESAGCFFEIPACSAAVLQGVHHFLAWRCCS
mgnify:CR=1 FL=1